jgi:hypothetical protein
MSKVTGLYILKGRQLLGGTAGYYGLRAAGSRHSPERITANKVAARRPTGATSLHQAVSFHEIPPVGLHTHFCRHCTVQAINLQL